MVLFNPDTGALDGDTYRQGVIDATTRALYPSGVRELFPAVGTSVWEYMQEPTDVNLSGLRDSIRASLNRSPLYTVQGVEVTHEEDKLEITLTLKFPDGTLIRTGL